MSSGVRLADDEIARLDDGSIEANLSDRFVGDEAVRQISDALANNSTKTRVLLDRNCIGADGAAALGDMLKVRQPEAACTDAWIPYYVDYECTVRT